MSDYGAMNTITDNNLIKERDVLKAHCERQHLALLNAIHSLPGGVTKADVRDVYDSVPHQSLAEIKAQAIEEALKIFEVPFELALTKEQTILCLKDYAKNLREQSK